MLRKRRRLCLPLILFCSAATLMLHYMTSLDFVKEMPSIQLDNNKDSRYTVGTPKTNIVYIKSERTAGSTISTIFKSYGLRNNLSMLLSSVKESDTSINTRELEPGKSWDVAPNNSTPAQMSMLGTRYSETFFDRHFPKNTVYIASIREPEQWFLSYVNNKQLFRKEGYTPQKVLKYDWMFYMEKRWVRQMDRVLHNNLLQWFGFGMPPKYQYNETEVLEYIKFIDQKFSLVMLSDYFYESLVLMRRLLNWSLSDIFFITLNKSEEEEDEQPHLSLTEEEREKLFSSSHNRGDWLLYQHFNQSLWRKISQQPQIHEEVKELKDLNRKVLDFCGSQAVLDRKSRLQLYSKFDTNVVVTAQQCIALRSQSKHSAEDLEMALDSYAPFRRTISAFRLHLEKYEEEPWPS